MLEEDFINELRSSVVFDKYVRFLSKNSAYKNMQVFYPEYCWALMNLYCVSNLKKSYINKTALDIYRDELKLFYGSLNAHQLSRNSRKVMPVPEQIGTMPKGSENFFETPQPVNESQQKLHLKFRQMLKDRPLPAGQEHKTVKIELSVVDFLIKENLLNLAKTQKTEVEYCDYSR